jgi:hypothetical protein
MNKNKQVMKSLNPQPLPQCGWNRSHQKIPSSSQHLTLLGQADRRDLNWLQRLSAPSAVVIGTLLVVH